MDLDPATARLGWKSSDDGQRTAPRQLANEGDIQYAFRELAGLQKRRRSGKPVFMEVVNLVQYSINPRQSTCSW
jgi:hypothetical protein